MRPSFWNVFGLVLLVADEAGVMGVPLDCAEATASLATASGTP